MCEHLLHPLRLQNLAREWLLEDTSSFDFAGCVVGDQRCEFTIYMKSSGVLAGIPFVNAIFTELNLQVTWLQKEGDRLHPITEVAKVSGPSKSLLLAERIALNVLCRASGVATAAARMTEILHKAGWKGTMASTRKTTPGFRMVEKYALLVGGVDMHRYDLSSMVMLKDNHIKLAGSITQAVIKARQLSGFSLKIEVECRSLAEAQEAGQANCDIVMLDNFDPEEGKRAALTLKLQYPNLLVEMSGGITEQNVLLYANPWSDIISSSSFIQGYPTVDFSMKVSSARGITTLNFGSS